MRGTLRRRVEAAFERFLLPSYGRLRPLYGLPAPSDVATVLPSRFPLPIQLPPDSVHLLLSNRRKSTPNVSSIGEDGARGTRLPPPLNRVATPLLSTMLSVHAGVPSLVLAVCLDRWTVREWLWWTARGTDNLVAVLVMQELRQRPQATLVQMARWLLFARHSNER